MIRYQDSDPFALLEQLKELLPRHYEELCPSKENLELAPDYDAYRRLFDCGMLRCITVHHDERLIGYIIFIVQPHLHYSKSKCAFEDVYWIDPDYRKGRIGLKMFKFAEKVLKAIGVNRVILHTKVFQDHSTLFEYMGYTHTDKLFTKFLE